MSLLEPFQVGGHRVSTRPAQAHDAAFLRAVYGSTREAELAPVPWTVAEKNAFLDQQFAAQAAAYRQNYPGAEFSILVVDGADAGRLYLHRRPAEIRIMDIALLPPFRRRGIGSATLERVLAAGAREDRSVTIHVELFNPALRLYERLGFRRVSQTDVYALMEWRPDPPLPPAKLA